MGKELPALAVRPIAKKLGIPDRLITFQVMRRTLGTDLQKHGTLKDAQGALRHASIGPRATSTCRRSRRASERDELQNHGDPRRKGEPGTDEDGFVKVVGRRTKEIGIQGVGTTGPSWTKSGSEGL